MKLFPQRIDKRVNRPIDTICESFVFACGKRLFALDLGPDFG